MTAPIEVDETRVREALMAVLDPELGESIVDLGLVQRISIAPHAVSVTLIATSATCPMGEMLLDDAGEAVRQACPPDTTVSVEIDWQTPWDPARLSPALKDSFGW